MAHKFPLTGKYSADHPCTLIDHIDVEGKGEWAGLRFRDYRWHVHFSPQRGRAALFYVRAAVDGRKVYAHQFLTGIKNADHADRDPFNNMSDNLREASGSEQRANRGVQRNNTSGLIGVTWNRRKCKWQAQVQVNGRCRVLGFFDDKNEAGRVRDKTASATWGDRAVLNFPDEMRAA